MGFMDELRKLTQPYDDDNDFYEGADSSLREAPPPSAAQREFENVFGNEPAGKPEPEERQPAPREGSEGGLFGGIGFFPVIALAVNVGMLAHVVDKAIAVGVITAGTPLRELLMVVIKLVWVCFFFGDIYKVLFIILQALTSLLLYKYSTFFSELKPPARNFIKDTTINQNLSALCADKQ